MSAGSMAARTPPTATTAPTIFIQRALEDLSSGVRVMRWAACRAREGCAAGRAAVFPAVPPALGAVYRGGNCCSSSFRFFFPPSDSFTSSRTKAMGQTPMANKNTTSAQENQSLFFFLPPDPPECP